MNIYEKLFEIKKAGIKLQRDTKAYNYKYATLDQIQKKLNGEFEKQKLLVLHTISSNKVRTEIIDIEAKENSVKSVISVISEIELTEGIKPQDKGSEITYYRRYNLLSLLDLEVEDDDGQKAQESSYKKESKKWLNYEDLVDIVEAGNTTEKQIATIIKEDGYTLGGPAKNAVRHYVETGELDKNLFFKK